MNNERRASSRIQMIRQNTQRPLLTKNISFISPENKRTREILKNLGNVTDPSYARSLNPTDADRPGYQGERFNKKGIRVKQSMCINAIRDLVDTSKPVPLFEDPTNSLPLTDSELSLVDKSTLVDMDDVKYKVGDIITKKNNKYEVSVNNTLNKIQVNEDLLEYTKQVANKGDMLQAPIFFVIIAPSIPHVMFMVIYEGKLYTAGYGYSDTTAKRAEDIYHKVQMLKGAIYSADYLTPTINQQCQIVWIGFLTPKILENLDNEFKKVHTIIYDGENDDTDTSKIVLSNDAILYSNTTYSESASVLPTSLGINNCLMWVKQITGIDLRCGMINMPTNCQEVSEEEFNEFKNMYINHSPELVDFIGNLQKRLLKKRGLFGGKRYYKRKTNKKRTCNRRINNGRRKFHGRKTRKH